MSKVLRVAILGASGYSGAELLRYLLLRRRITGDIDIVALTASRRAGDDISEVHPQFSFTSGLPTMRRWQDVSWEGIDVAFCALPHGTTQEVVSELWHYKDLRIIDLSADFRLRDLGEYRRWYGKEHGAPDLQSSAVYGLSELNGEKIGHARLVANPGCYATTVQLALLPLAEIIDPSCISIDAKSGVSGAGRNLREDLLYCESNEDFRPYAVSGHRHVAEIEQGLAMRLGVSSVSPISFIPHLAPMSRGILASLYLRLRAGADGADAVSLCLSAYEKAYGNAGSFIRVLEAGSVPSVKLVAGTNRCLLSVVADRRAGYVVVFSATDNLGKGAAGQALQNMNLMLGYADDYGFAESYGFAGGDGFAADNAAAAAAALAS